MEQLFSRLACVAESAAILRPIVAAGQQYGYRNNMQFSYGADAINRPVLGLKPSGHFDEVLDVPSCPLQSQVPLQKH